MAQWAGLTWLRGFFTQHPSPQLAVAKFRSVLDKKLTIMKALELTFIWTFYLSFLHTAECFYLPGLAPVSYCEKQLTGDSKCKVSLNVVYISFIFFILVHFKQVKKLKEALIILASDSVSSEIRTKM